MFAWLGKLVRDRRGATLVEYGLILALVVLVLMAALRNMAGATIGIWNDVSDKVTAA